MESPAASANSADTLPKSNRARARLRAQEVARQIALNLHLGRVDNRPLSESVIAGFLSNGQHESNFDPRNSGDGGTAHGYFQWRAQRALNFQRIIGVHPRNSTPAQSAQFVLWEMNNPQAAGMTVDQRDRILTASTPEQAGRLIDQYYERSNGRTREARARTARLYFNNTLPQFLRGGGPQFTAR